MSPSEQLRQAIKRLDLDAVRRVLASTPDVAGRPFQRGGSDGRAIDPLNYLSDACAGAPADADDAATIATLLVEAGASLVGHDTQETPLIAAASLGVERVADVLVRAGARIDATCTFGATALHWAAYTGLSDTVRLLLAHGAVPDARCTEFRATPLFWAVHGYSRYGPSVKRDQLGAATILFAHGADPMTTDRSGRSLKSLAADAAGTAMTDLIASYART